MEQELDIPHRDRWYNKDFDKHELEAEHLLCGFFEPKNDSSSATICKHCGREKWMHHPKAT